MVFYKDVSALEFHFNYSSFYSPGTGTYAELYFRINGQSIDYVEDESGQFSGAVEILYMIKQNDSIRSFDKYFLKSPSFNEEKLVNFDLIDLRRIQLKPGKYSVDIFVTDVNDTTNKVAITKGMLLYIEEENLFISDISLIDIYSTTEETNLFSKHQYDMTPYVINYYPTARKKIIFYAEVYNSMQEFGEDMYLVNYQIHFSNGNQLVGKLRGFIKQNPAKVNIIFAELDLKELPTGNYDLVLEVRDKQNVFIKEKRLFFFRTNTETVIDEMSLAAISVANSFVDSFDLAKITYYLESVLPISKSRETLIIDNLLKSNDEQLMKQFYLNFWQKRNSRDPYGAFMRYQAEVSKVNDAYSTSIDYGFETDRGIVYLKYKPPNEIVRDYTEPDAVPYEIWHYYSLNEQRNVKFVFYNPDLVTNDFILVHSDARGEVQNQRWKSLTY